MFRASRPRLTLLTGVVTLALVSCAPDAASQQGQDISDLYGIFMTFAAVIFVVTAGLIGWSLIRFRERPGDDELPPQFHSNLKLEVLWFAIPQIIVIVLFVLSTVTLGDVNEQKTDVEVVTVTGYQWGWSFDYANGTKVVGTPDEPADAVIPTGDVAFIIRSTDVVHSFYVPRFLIKRDAVPGRETRIDVHVDEPGDYSGACAEFCGLLHDRMLFSITAVTPEEFQAWLNK
ncbi:MAG: cytochrome c oxidase subunit [Actinomycetota bacterium]|nr:cytochrome c oxidase subunit [Actinomycetota bacterium]